MKEYAWDSDKNEWLREERGISFEDILFQIEKGFLLDIYDHPNSKKYPGQKIFVIELDGYAYLVPFVESKSEIFLKTIIPSRKATRDYIKDREGEE
ncbi:BrnT family toxin [Leptospira venezuelensis]|uniref:BrnT family toxin n=1 Tax=Leptospira venezuelensis TaxID=1958811 RepID=UPI000A3D5EDE|nr:BrnT family toxin [Leptospira venezuelensis]